MTIWSILIAPGLCSAGWIEHLCADHEDTACGHETECFDDPCASPTLRPDRSEGLAVDQAPVPVAGLDFVFAASTVSAFHLPMHRSERARSLAPFSPLRL
jgi:hypothetical protein